MRRWMAVWAILAAVQVCPAWASLNIPSDGSDGVLNITTHTTIDLSKAVTGKWNDAVLPVNAGKGIYDPDQWVVVYKYQSVDVAASSTLSFTNHASRAPVVWLVDGNVTVNGTINLCGGQGLPATTTSAFSEPGPGGFRGACRHAGAIENQRGSSGMGPGGANLDGSAGSGAGFGEEGQGWWPTRGKRYGNYRLIPLVGGSGGSPSTGISNNWWETAQVTGGGAGGGAILIAAKGTVTMNGRILANGGAGISGSGGGSGGGIRILADLFAGNGLIQALGGGGDQAGGSGRTRIECNTNAFTGSLAPTPYTTATAQIVQIWPDVATEPSITVVSLGGKPAPADPKAAMQFPDTDLSLETTGTDELIIEGHNVPLNAKVIVLVTPLHGARCEIPATYVSGDKALSTWKAVLELKNGISSFQIRVD